MLPKGPKSSYWPPQRRYGQAVPVVELVVWDNVPDSFIAYIEGRFRAKKLQLHTSYLQQNDVDKDTLMQHFVMEGVTAVIMVDRNDEVRGKVYMQVFERSGAADTSNVRFDGMFCFCFTALSSSASFSLFLILTSLSCLRIRWYIC
jgi:hypothetical protein